MAPEKTAEELAEEAAADVADANKKEETTESAETTEEEPKKEAPKTVSQDDLASAVVAKLQDLSKKDLTPEQREAEVKKLEEDSGFNRKQLGFMAKAVASENLRANKALYEERGQIRAEQALGKFSGKLKDKVVEAMRAQPLEVQANPESWENMAYLVKGKFMEGSSGSADGGGSGKSTVDGGKMKGLTDGSGGKGGSSGKGKKDYNDDEKTMIRVYFNGDVEAYETRKSTKTVGQGKQGGTATNAADKEYERLTGGTI